MQRASKGSLLLFVKQFMSIHYIFVDLKFGIIFSSIRLVNFYALIYTLISKSSLMYKTYQIILNINQVIMKSK